MLRGEVTLLLLLACSTAAPAEAADPGDCTVYVFLDVNRRPIKTRHREVVPPAQRQALVTYRDCAARIDEQRARDAAARAASPGAATITARAEREEAAQRKMGALRGWARAWAEKIAARRNWFFLLGLVSIAAAIGVIVAGFRQSFLWGLLNIVGVFLFPPLVLVFVVLHWDVARVPFLAYLFSWLATIALLVL